MVFTMLVNMVCVNSLKRNLQHVISSHFINRSLQKEADIEVISNSDIMKHLVENHLDTFYVVISRTSIIYALEDKEFYKSHDSMK